MGDFQDNLRALLVLVVVITTPSLARADCDPAFKAGHLGKCPDAVQAMVHPAPKDIPKNDDFDKDCGSDVELDSKDSPLSHLGPPLDQDGAGICYAESAAGLIDAYRFTHGDTAFDKHASPVALAIGMAERSNEKSWFGKKISVDKVIAGGGGVCDAVDYGIDAGVCDQKTVLERVGAGDIKKFMTVFGQIYDDYRKWKDGRSTIATVFNAAYGDGHRMREEAEKRGEAIAVAQHCMRDYLRFSPDMIPPSRVLDKVFQQNDPLKFVQTALTYACSNGRSVKPLGLKSCVEDPVAIPADPKAVSQTIHRLLATKTPVAITFCAGPLSNPSFVGVSSSGRAPPALSLSADCGTHAALVLGQRRDAKSGKCQFKVRNSWGGSCAGYRWCSSEPVLAADKASLTCASAGWDCSEGTGEVWVNADSLSKNVFALEHVE